MTLSTPKPLETNEADYLSDKEASTEKVTIKNNRKFVEVETEPSKLYWSGVEEASKGECVECHRTSRVVDLDNGCPFCGTDKEDFITHPPQQEESRGECIIDPESGRCISKAWHECKYRKPQLKEESPKEDEQENQPQPDSKVEMVRMDLVNKHYVSKEKIKKVFNGIQPAAVTYAHDKGFGWAIPNSVFMGIIKSLGLEEL